MEKKFYISWLLHWLLEYGLGLAWWFNAMFTVPPLSSTFLIFKEVFVVLIELLLPLIDWVAFATLTLWSVYWVPAAMRWTLLWMSRAIEWFIFSDHFLERDLLTSLLINLLSFALFSMCVSFVCITTLVTINVGITSHLHILGTLQWLRMTRIVLLGFRLTLLSRIKLFNEHSNFTKFHFSWNYCV